MLKTGMSEDGGMGEVKTERQSHSLRPLRRVKTRSLPDPNLEEPRLILSEGQESGI